ncbi:MAG TPA: adenylate/guanylate cyclase domain-containing protein [Acidimicrobiia bacterium]|nr:adenylate/guanylate cyclase domain-containing protein [Acidimicrobiia bacterium]
MILPTGIVSFLFTDVVGSSSRWERAPESMREAIRLHDRVLDEAITSQQGQVLKKMGDGYMAVFHDPGDAVAAAVAAQQGLRSKSWDPVLGGFESRMGAHTGPADLIDGDYFGPTVNRAARLEAAGHGGQILISHATRSLCAEKSGVRFEELGEHHLRGLERPERVYQVVADGLPSEFPPLETESRPTNVPVATQELVGRTEELVAVLEAFDTGRLFTITGPGGAGKTTLALEVARRSTVGYPAGVWLVELAGLVDGGSIPGEILGALRRPAVVDRDPADSLIEAVAGQRMLLVIDNCEHLLSDVAELVSRILRSTSDVRVLATSRERLSVTGERVWQIPVLRLPTAITTEAVATSGAGALFELRARSADPGFTLTDDNAVVVHDLCHRLDGLPLAIELACARLRSMTLDDLAARIEDRFRILRGAVVDQAARHRTLRDTVAWSYDLLGGAEQVLFRRLSVFVGGFDLQAAEAVGGSEDVIDLLDHLVAQSLVQFNGGRYRMLETIRQFGMEMLDEQTELQDARRAHLEWLAALAREGGRELEGRNQMHWLDRFRREIDNIRAALTWAVEVDPLTGSMAAGALTRFFWMNATEADPRTLTDGRSFLAEGYSLTVRLLEAGGDDLPAKLRARLQTGIGGLLCVRLGRYTEAVERLDEAEELWEQLEDPRNLGWAVFYAAVAGYSLRTSDQTLDMYQRALELHLEAEDRFGQLVDTLLISSVLGGAGRYEEGRIYLDRYDAAVQKIGVPALLAHADDAVALFDALQDRVTEDSQRRSAASLVTFRQINNYACLTHALGGSAMILARMGDRRAPGVVTGLMSVIRNRLNMVIAPYEDRTTAIGRVMDEAFGLDVFSDGPAQEEWSAAIAEGRALDPDEGIDWVVGRLAAEPST